MGAGWLYYHKQPPRRMCPMCGRRHYLRRMGVMSNGADVWKLICPDHKDKVNEAVKIVTSDGYEN